MQPEAFGKENTLAVGARYRLLLIREKIPFQPLFIVVIPRRGWRIPPLTLSLSSYPAAPSRRRIFSSVPGSELRGNTLEKKESFARRDGEKKSRQRGCFFLI